VKTVPAPVKDLPKKDAQVPAPASKPGTPKPAAAIPTQPTQQPGARAEPPKTSTLPSLPHSSSLPSRPDVTVPGRYPSDRYGPVRNQEGRREPLSRDAQDPRDNRVPPRETRDYRDGRDLRDPRETRDPRDLRDHRDPRDIRAQDGRADRPVRDVPGPDRRPEPPSRESLRHPDRDWAARGEPPPRWNDHGPSERDRPPRDRLPPSHDGRLPRDNTSATPPLAQARPSASQLGPRESASSQDRGRVNPDDRPDLVNPGRAALINDTRAPPPRPARDEPRERVSSRTQSPRAAERRNAEPIPGDRTRDDRHGRPHHAESHPSNRDGHGPPSHLPGRERPLDRDNDRTMPDRARERSFQEPSSSRHPDADHGRLNHQDPNYGRLNPVAGSEIPSGPRGRGRDAARVSSVNGPPHRPDDHIPAAETHRAPTPERQPPTGPSGSRTSRRGRGHDANPTMTPTAPASVPPAATVIHPERAGRIDSPGPSRTPAQAPPSSSPAPSAGVHPDRLGQIGGQPPTRPASRANLAPLQTPDRHAPAPTGSGPPAPRPSVPDVASVSASDHLGGRTTPTGPASSVDRSRNRSERLMRGIQDTISGGSNRRSGPRGHIAGSDAQVLAGGSPVTTPVQERHDPMRRDFGPDRAPPASGPASTTPREPRGPPLDDFHGSTGRDGDRNYRREHRSDRSGRPSRRSSRERSPERDRDSKTQRDYRERRPEGPGAPLNDSRDADRERPIPPSLPPPPRRPVREPNSANMEPLGGLNNRDPNREPLGGARDSRHRGDSRGEPRGEGRGEGRGEIRGEGRGDGGGRAPEEWAGPGRGGRGGGGPRDSGFRPGDERRDQREDRGRKRRSDEGVGSLGSEREKRQRR